MPLTFAELVAPQTFTQMQQVLLNALQGLGVVVGSNGGSGVPVGTGSLALSGTPTAQLSGVANNPYSVVVVVTTSGELGTAQVKISVDGGVSYAAPVTVPGSGQLAVTGAQGATGVTATFAAGPTGAGTSFVLADQYAFNLYVPSFPVNAWQSGSVPRVLAMTDAQALASWTQTLAAIAAGGVAAINPLTGQPYSTGPWLDLLGQNVYQLTRTGAVSAHVTCILHDTQGQGPFTIVAGSLIAAAANGQLYTNAAGGTLTKYTGGSFGPSNGELSLTWEALTPGTASSAADNTISTLNTALPGVTVNNPGPGSMTVTGADSETDLAYAQRMMNRWPTIGIGATAATYQYWASQSDASIVKSLVQTDSSVAGQVDVWIASATGPASGGAVTACQNYINARTPLTTTAVVAAAIAHNVSYSGTVYYYSSKTTSGAAAAAVAAALTALHAASPIGVDNTPTTYLYLDQIYAAIENCFGVRNFTLATPAADVGLVRGEVAVFLANTLAYTGV